MNYSTYNQIRAWGQLKNKHTYSFWKADGIAYEVLVWRGRLYHKGVDVTESVLSDINCVWYYDRRERRRNCI
jgi:hypothetical protein